VQDDADAFGGSVIRFVSRHQWPFDRGLCIVTDTRVTSGGPSQHGIAQRRAVAGGHRPRVAVRLADGALD